MGIDWAPQYSKEAGPGLWITFFSALAAFIITACSLKYGEKNITVSDWITLFLALTAIPLWLAIEDPLWSVILISLIEVLATYPTFRKSWHKPHQERALTFTLDGAKFCLSTIALEKFTLTTYLYPMAIVLTDVVLVGMLLFRRRLISQEPVNNYA